MIAVIKPTVLTKTEKGATAVEFALIAPILFVVIFAIFEFGIIFYVNLTMQYAVREGARYSITGQSDLDSNPDAQSKQRSLAVIQKIKNNSMFLYDALNIQIRNFKYSADSNISVPIGSYKVSDLSDPSKQPANDLFGQAGSGQAGEIVVIKLECKWKTIILGRLIEAWFPNTSIFTDGFYNFTVAASSRVEAF